jgi:hypothetical protein
VPGSGTEKSTCGFSAPPSAAATTSVSLSLPSPGQRSTRPSLPAPSAVDAWVQFGRGCCPTCTGTGTAPYSSVLTRSLRMTSRYPVPVATTDESEASSLVPGRTSGLLAPARAPVSGRRAVSSLHQPVSPA